MYRYMYLSPYVMTLVQTGQNELIAKLFKLYCPGAAVIRVRFMVPLRFSNPGHHSCHRKRWNTSHIVSYQKITEILFVADWVDHRARPEWSRPRHTLLASQHRWYAPSNPPIVHALIPELVHWSLSVAAPHTGPDRHRTFVSRVSSNMVSDEL